MRLFDSLISLMYWLQVFATPALLSGIAALFTWSNNRTIGIALLCIGVIGGIILAEFVRRKYGLANFFSQLYSNELEKKSTK